MVTCSQCEGGMSSYALSCPHCGNVNQTAPQAIFLQEERERTEKIHVNDPSPVIAIEVEEAVITAAPVSHKISDRAQWSDDIFAEWRALTSFTQYTIQALFGGGLLIVIGLWLYVILTQ